MGRVRRIRREEDCGNLEEEGVVGKGREWKGREDTFLQILPSVRPDSCAVHVVRIPAPDRIQTFRLQIESGFEGGGVVESEVGAEPVDYPWSRHCRRRVLRLLLLFSSTV